MVLNSADYTAGPSTSTTEPQSVLVEAPTWELNSPSMAATGDFSLDDEFWSALGSPSPNLSFSSLWNSDDFSAGPSTGPTRPQPVLVGPSTWELNSPSVVATVDFSLDEEFWSATGSPFPDLSFSSLWISDDPSTGITGPQPVLVEPQTRELNSPSMAATRDLSLDNEFRSVLDSPCPDLPFSSVWNSVDYSAGPLTGTTGAPPVPVEPPTRFRLGKRMTVEVNKHLGLSETSFFVVEFNHTPQGESINWRNVEINYPDIDKVFKEQESYVTLFERQVMVTVQKLAYLRPDAKDFSVLKKIRHGAYDLVLEVEDFLLNKITDFLPKSKISPDVDEGCEEQEIVFGRMKLQNLQMKVISSGVILMCIQLKGRYVMGRIDIFGHRKTQICNGADMQVGSSEQQPTVGFDVTCNGGNNVITDQSDILVTGLEKNSIKMISPLLSPEILPQYYGMKQDDAAKLLGVCRSTMKRFCRKHGIRKWPFRKGKKGSNDLPKLNCGNESVRGTEGALCQPSLTIGPINRAVGSMCWPAELRRSNLQQTESIPSAPYCVPNTPVSMQPRTSAAQMPTEHTGCSEFLKSLEQAEVVLESTETVPPCAELPPEHRVSSTVHSMPDVAAMQDMKIFNIKATYRTDIIQFPLSSSSRKVELEDNLLESLKLMRGKFSMKYLDTEEGDWILITCDKDLQYCLDVSKQLGKRTIKMLIEDIGSV